MIDEAEVRAEARHYIINKMQSELDMYRRYKEHALTRRTAGDSKYANTCSIFVEEFERAIAAYEGKREAAILSMLRHATGLSWRNVEEAISLEFERLAAIKESGCSTTPSL